MKDINQLKDEYDQLSTADKAKVGQSLVKVNLGVGLPDDLKIVAAFLKGSPLIAKAGTLDELVNSLHSHESSQSISHTNEPTEVLVSKSVEINKTQIKNLTSFDEDSEVTHKEKL